MKSLFKSRKGDIEIDELLKWLGLAIGLALVLGTTIYLFGPTAVKLASALGEKINVFG